MKQKTYNLYKTARKTAKENNLVISRDNNKILFDFSLLEIIPDEDAKKIIMADSIRDCGSASFEREAFYGSCQRFVSYSGIATYYCHHIFDEKSGKKLYTIKELANIKHNRGDRGNAYDAFQVTNSEYSSNTLPPMLDWEI